MPAGGEKTNGNGLATILDNLAVKPRGFHLRFGRLKLAPNLSYSAPRFGAVI